MTIAPTALLAIAQAVSSASSSSVMTAVLTGLGTGLGLIVAIGAQNAWVLRQGVRREHIGLVIAICALSDLVLITVGTGAIRIVTGLAPWVLEVLRWGGVVYLAAFALSSGMAALELVTRTLAPHGSRIVALRDLYGGSFRFLEVLAEEGAADVDFVLGIKGLRKALATPADLVIIETPTNPMMEEIPIPEAAELARAAGARLVVDNTFYTPVVQRPLELGADVVVHSGTKYLGGHNDVMAGVAVVADDVLAERLNYRLNTTGATLGPFDCFLLLRGLKTLALRMERHEANATAIAEFLRSSPHVTRVLYPGHSGMVSFDLAESVDVSRFLESVRVFTFAESLGGVESLVTCPSVQTHADVPVEVRASYGLSDRLMRLSVGIEHVDDLIADLAQAFEAAGV